MGHETLYQRITEDIVGKILSGRFAPGDRIASVTEIRKEYNVSHITALRAFRELSGNGYVSKVPGRGYFVERGKSVPFTAHKMIGCLMRGISALKTDHYFNEIMAGMQREAAVANYGMLFSGPAVRSLIQDASPGREAVEAALEIRNLVCGYLLDERISDEIAQQIFDETGKPLVIVNRRTNLAVNAVYPDIPGAVEKLFAALKRMNYAHFILCDSGMNSVMRREMQAGYRSVLAQYGISESQVRHVEKTGLVPFEETCTRIMEAFRSLKGKRTALLAPTDILAVELHRHLRRDGVRIPDDLGLVGFCGLGAASNDHPELTTLQTDTFGMGVLALQLLLNIVMRGTFASKGYPMPLKLIFGETI